MSTVADVVRVHVPQRSYKSELRAIKIVWTRELIRFRKDRMRIVTSLIQPLLFLFVLGSGLNTVVQGDVDLRTFIYPGVLCISVHTVKTHVVSLLTKLDADNRAHLASTAVQRGVLTV